MARGMQVLSLAVKGAGQAKPGAWESRIFAHRGSFRDNG
jgi:hypothetical protein